MSPNDHDATVSSLSRIVAVTLDRQEQKEFTNLRFAGVFLIIVIVAAAVGFGGIAVDDAAIVKPMFFMFLALFVASLVEVTSRRR